MLQLGPLLRPLEHLPLLELVELSAGAAAAAKTAADPCKIPTCNDPRHRFDGGMFAGKLRSTRKPTTISAEEKGLATHRLSISLMVLLKPKQKNNDV